MFLGRATVIGKQKTTEVQPPRWRPLPTNVNELEKVTDPLTRLAPLATLSPKGARAGIQVDAPLAPLGARVPEVRGRVRGCAG